jgi:adenylate kinase
MDDDHTLAREVREAIQGGKLAPDGIVVQMVERALDEKLPQGGVLFDGFPRTLQQAEALETLLAARNAAVDMALWIEVSRAELERRVSGRRECMDCDRQYNVYTAPSVMPEVCDVCGNALIHRADDAPDAVRVRLDVYQRLKAPLLAFYEARGILREVDGESSKEAVFERLSASLQERIA